MARVKQGFERLDVNGNVSISGRVSPRNQLQKCMKGQLVVVQKDPMTNTSSGEFFGSGHYRLLDCDTKKPKCGTKSAKISWEKTGETAMEISFGCFPARDLKNAKKRELDSSELAIEMNDFRDIYEYWCSEKTFLQKFFETFKPANNNLIQDRHGHENKWVESLSNDVFFSIETESTALGGLGVQVHVAYENITLLMLFYCLFICVSIVVHVIWLLSITFKSLKQGYGPVEQPQTVEDVEKTVEEME